MENSLNCPCCGFRQTSYCAEICQECRFPLRAWKSAKNDELRHHIEDEYFTAYPERGDRYKIFLQKRGEPSKVKERHQLADADKIGAETDSQVCSDRLNKVTVSIEWPHMDVKFIDTNFEFPKYAKFIYRISRLVAWATALLIVVGGLCFFYKGEAVVGIVCLVVAPIGLLGALYTARLVYELTILFFEQLKVMRQIRDFLVAKLVG